MDDRLVQCFQAVFPNLTEAEVRAASTATTGAWDSVAAITLVSVIEEEFSVQIDFEVLPQLTSFALVRDYLSSLHA